MTNNSEKEVVDRSLILKLIMNEAIFRDNAAQALIIYQEKEFPHSLDIGDSAYLLRLFSIELFIKWIFLFEKGKMHYGHDVKKIFSKLKEETQEEIINIYNNSAEHVITKDELRLLLEKIHEYIIKIRYPFEDFIKINNLCYKDLMKKFKKSPIGNFTFAKIVYEHGKVIYLLNALKTYCISKKIE